MNKVEKFMFEHFEPQIEKLGYCFADVEYVKEKDSQYLRLFIDTLEKETRVDISDCEKVSRYLDEKLDLEALFLDKEYILEVSSPGIERPLKREKDFLSFLGSIIQIKLYKPVDRQKIFIGELLAINDRVIEIGVEENIYTFSLDDIAKANLYFEF